MTDHVNNEQYTLDRALEQLNDLATDTAGEALLYYRDENKQLQPIRHLFRQHNHNDGFIGIVASSEILEV